MNWLETKKKNETTFGSTTLGGDEFMTPQNLTTSTPLKNNLTLPKNSSKSGNESLNLTPSSVKKNKKKDQSSLSSSLGDSSKRRSSREVGRPAKYGKGASSSGFKWDKF